MENANFEAARRLSPTMPQTERSRRISASVTVQLVCLIFMFDLPTITTPDRALIDARTALCVALVVHRIR